MKKTAIAIATAASLAFFAGPLAADSSATEAGANTGMGGSMTDTQSVGQSGAMERDQETFDRLDQNGDGKLDENELSAYGSTAAGQPSAAQGSGDMMDKLDQNSDGEVSQEEFQQDVIPEPGRTGSGSTGSGTGTGTGGGATQ